MSKVWSSVKIVRASDLAVVAFIVLMAVAWGPALHANCGDDLDEVAISGQLYAQNAKLVRRIETFAQAWPENVAVVNEVKFGNEDANALPRKVVVVSLDGLDPIRKQKLMDDYLDAVEQNTVSFPFSSKITHLFTRLGRNSYDINLADFSNGLRTSLLRREVTPSKSIRIEPIVTLTDDEIENMHTYVKNIIANPKKTIGFGFNWGARSGETIGRLDNNHAVKWCESHNCTSTFSTAPIGDSGRPLWKLLGADRFATFQKPPIWWHFVIERARAERVPYVMYWTNSNLAKAVTTEMPATVSGQYSAKPY